MTIEVRLTVTDAELETYATARIERAAAPDGFLADGASQVASVNLTAGQTYYVWEDLTGTPAHWYRTRLATSADPAVFSAYSPPFQGSFPPLVARSLVFQEVGIEEDDAKATRLRLLIDAVSSRIRRITRRDFAGGVTTWDEVYRLDGASTLVLRHVPIVAVASIRAAYFDGTEDDPYETTLFRVEDARRGRIQLARRPGYVRVVYTASGAVLPEVITAALEWILFRWNTWARDPGLANYKTGDDSESYFASLAGKPPPEVLATLRPLIHNIGGGPI